MRILCGFVVVILFASSAALAQGPAATVVSTPHCEYTGEDSTPARGHLAFPDGDLFRPVLADPKEPRVAFRYARARYSVGTLPAETGAQATNAGIITVGGVVGMWRRESGRSCRGVQVSLIGGVFSQFNLDAYSKDLINSDFIVGTQVTAKTGMFSTRLRLYHQSSHLGDEFVRSHPEAGDINFGFQAIDGLVSVDRDWWRVYGGGGYLFFMNDRGGSGLLQGGGEVRGGQPVIGILRPIAGVDMTSLEERSWGLTTSTMAGLEWTSPAVTRRMRASVFFINGYVPFGQFALQQRSKSFGLQFQIEF